MSSTLSIAASGLAAAFQRLQVSADNVANADSDGPTASASAGDQAQYQPAYIAQQFNQVATQGGGTKAVVSNAQPGTVTAYDPTAPNPARTADVSAPTADMPAKAPHQ